MRTFKKALEPHKFELVVCRLKIRNRERERGNVRACVTPLQCASFLAILIVLVRNLICRRALGGGQSRFSPIVCRLKMRSVKPYHG